MVEPDDSELVRRFQRGDKDAFAQFVQRHQHRLYRMACVWVHSPVSAQDAVQEALYRSYTGFARFRFQSHPKTWIYRLLRNVCNDINRQQPTRGDVVEDQVADDEFGADSKLSPALRSALQALPDRQRDAVVLRVLEELSVRDTALVMRCREGTVKAHLHKALAALRSNMEINDVD